MYGCESWTIKKAEHWRIEAFELWCWRQLLRVPWREIQPVHPKRNESWISMGRTDAEAETSILWPPDEKNWLIWKDLEANLTQMSVMSTIFSVMETRNPRSSCQQGLFLVRPLFMTCRWLPSHCVLTWLFLCACACMQKMGTHILFLEGHESS